ncbi:MAG: TetR/AcrR family transcriptional regulator [Sulfurovaceae bacterium]|nr:TetR/AcrR family transcriptional regulator [Sulfurovaceae bacterium]MDD5548187.1 TetR/AcrR family transcriptional regulator [Sulfurovaceae bacterium]
MSQGGKRVQKKESIIQAALTLFSVYGFHKTTIPNIAKRIGMSSGNLYNYFPSKEILAQEIIKYTSEVLGEEIRKINQQKKLTTYKKIHKIVEVYFKMAIEKPEMIEYFLRVYLSHREVFVGECQRMVCVAGFITEIMIFFSDGVECGELRDQDFFSAFGLFMGYLGGMAFLNGEAILSRPLKEYTDDITQNIYNALKT